MWQKWKLETYYSIALIWKNCSCDKNLSRIRSGLILSVWMKLCLGCWKIMFRMMKNKFQFCENLAVTWFTHGFQKLWLCQCSGCLAAVVFLLYFKFSCCLLYFLLLLMNRETCYFFIWSHICISDQCLVTSVDYLKLTVTISASSWHWTREEVPEAGNFFITSLFSWKILLSNEKILEYTISYWLPTRLSATYHNLLGLPVQLVFSPSHCLLTSFLMNIWWKQCWKPDWSPGEQCPSLSRNLPSQSFHHRGYKLIKHDFPLVNVYWLLPPWVKKCLQGRFVSYYFQGMRWG